MDLDRFLASLREHMPGAPVTRILVALNLLVFALTAAFAGSIVSMPASVLADWGGNDGRLTLAGEPWRLLTSVFLHGGLLHIGLNMLALYQAGQLVERLLGSGRFVAVYLCSGLFASLASVWWRQDVVSIGASGAIFGIFGALLAFLLVNRRHLPKTVFASMRTMTLSFVGYSLLLGFAIPGVDNAAHIGGVVGGFVLGWLLSAVRGFQSVAFVAALAVGALAIWDSIDRPPARSFAVAQLADKQPLLAARELEIMEALRNGTAKPAEVLAVVDKELKPNWDRLIAGLQVQAAAGDRRAASLLEYARLERSALEALSLALSTGHPGWISTAAQLRAEANVALSRALASQRTEAGKRPN